MTTSGTGRLTAGRFFSCHIGMETGTSSNKTLARRRLKPLLPALRTTGILISAQIGPSFLYLVSEKRFDPPARLMRVPVAGGPPELVLTGEKIKNFSCAREANLCVVAEEVAGKQILTTFDPSKGRREKLPLLDYPLLDYPVGRHILSPQGRLIETIASRPDGLHIRIRSLMGAPAEEVIFRNLTGEYQFSGWSLDGKGIYITQWTYSDFTTLYAGLDGNSQVLWKRGSSPGWSFGHAIPSPDGRHLAFTVVTYQMNAWMLENF